MEPLTGFHVLGPLLGLFLLLVAGVLFVLFAKLTFRLIRRLV
ncbi:hypothetical protein [Thermococcus peptonophilus]|nr:hypothetical protein [Thermococcus peptonophilus]